MATERKGVNRMSTKKDLDRLREKIKRGNKMSEQHFCPFKDDKPCTTDCALFDYSDRQCTFLLMTQYLDSISKGIFTILKKQ